MCIYMCKHSFLFHLASEPWRMLAGHICTIQRIRSLIQKKKKKQEVLSHHGSSRQGWIKLTHSVKDAMTWRGESREHWRSWGMPPSLAYSVTALSSQLGLFLFCVMDIIKADACIAAVPGAAAHHCLPAESLWAVYEGSGWPLLGHMGAECFSEDAVTLPLSSCSLSA